LKKDYVDSVCRNVETSLRNFKRCDAALAREGEAQDPMVIPFVFRLKGAYLRLRERVVPRDCVVLSREALCFPRRHEWHLEEVRSPPVSWQKSCSLASAWRRLSLSGREYPVPSPAGSLLRSPIRIILSLGCFSTHAAMISQTSCCSSGLAAVNWYKLIMTNLPPLLVVVDRANALPLTTGWRPFPRRSCRPG